MESDGDDLISSDSLFHDKCLRWRRLVQRTLFDIEIQPVVDTIQIANQVYVPLESSDGRVQIYRLGQRHARNSKKCAKFDLNSLRKWQSVKAIANEFINFAEMRAPSYQF